MEKYAAESQPVMAEAIFLFTLPQRILFLDTLVRPIYTAAEELWTK
jgi:hypothetical protein